MPHSRYGQPWPFTVGHMISATIGVSCALLIPDTTIACGLAIGLSLLAMLYLNALHPPGGAIALAPILGGDEIQSLGYSFVLAPVALNVLVLLIIALLISRIIPGHEYPTKKDNIDDD